MPSDGTADTAAKMSICNRTATAAFAPPIMPIKLSVSSGLSVIADGECIIDMIFLLVAKSCSYCMGINNGVSE